MAEKQPSDLPAGHAAIIGTGMIAVSMAVLLTGHGVRTTMLARSDESAGRAKTGFMQYGQDLVDSGLLNQAQAARFLERLTVTRAWADLAEVDFIIESVYEQLDVKHDVYRQIEQVCRPDVIIASMTSGIGPDLLAEGLVNKSRLIVAHPFMPPHLIPCVEIVRSAHTSDETLSATVRFFKWLDRAPIVLKKSIDGFIVNRIQYAMLREAISLIEQGVASAEDIDQTLLTSIGPRYSAIGLFEHMENAGLDLVAGIQGYLNPTLCNATGVQPSLKIHVDAGEFGSKSGHGYLDWSKRDLSDLRKRRTEPYIRFFNWTVPD